MSILVSASRDAYERERVEPSEPMSICAGVLLPDQFLTSRDAETRSTRLLMIAVLRDAIDCFRNHLLDPSRRGRRLYGEAETWLLAENASTPLAFEAVCDALGLDVDYVRGRLCEWRRREIARAPDTVTRRPPVRRSGAGGHPACGRRAS